MFTYQIRKRKFKLGKDVPLAWPADTEIQFHFRPLQPFGMELGGGRTAVRGVEGTVHFDLNTGAHTVESKTPLKPLEVYIEDADRLATLRGNVLTVKARSKSNEELTDMIWGIYYGFPLLLNVEFADPPFVERVEGRIGSIGFRWELVDWTMDVLTTTQHEQESNVSKAWFWFDVITRPERRRLIAALHYFHVACRLARSGQTAGEFLPEVLLNLAKTLEVLFPPTGDGRTRDAVRANLAMLGYPEIQIESDFIPAMVLRNEIDVGRVELGVFTMGQLRVLHSYTERVEAAFRDLLRRVIAKVDAGEFEIAPYSLQKPRPEAVKIIETLREAMHRADRGNRK
jgi:hypothetical protein